jgi:hypothetical protein
VADETQAVALGCGAKEKGYEANTGCASTRASNRLTAGFEYIGPARQEDARRLGVV